MADRLDHAMRGYCGANDKGEVWMAFLQRMETSGLWKAVPTLLVKSLDANVISAS